MEIRTSQQVRIPSTRRMLMPMSLWLWSWHFGSWGVREDVRSLSRTGGTGTKKDATVAERGNNRDRFAPSRHVVVAWRGYTSPQRLRSMRPSYRSLEPRSSSAGSLSRYDTSSTPKVFGLTFRPPSNSSRPTASFSRRFEESSCALLLKTSLFGPLIGVCFLMMSAWRTRLSSMSGILSRAPNLASKMVRLEPGNEM
jgi:hypothetical protein